MLNLGEVNNFLISFWLHSSNNNVSNTINQVICAIDRDKAIPHIYIIVAVEVFEIAAFCEIILAAFVQKEAPERPTEGPSSPVWPSFASCFTSGALQKRVPTASPTHLPDTPSSSSILLSKRVATGPPLANSRIPSDPGFLLVRSVVDALAEHSPTLRHVVGPLTGHPAALGDCHGEF